MTENHLGEVVVQLQQVCKQYGGNAVLKGIDLEVRKGEFLTLLGPSGCGKTTVLRMLAGFETADSGMVAINGRDVSRVPPEKRHVNTVFQSYALFPHMTVFDNVAFGLQNQSCSSSEIERRVMESLKMVKMSEFAGRRPQQLSGGQQQRVAIARAVVNQPLVLLLDESLSALDYKLRKTMQLELKHLQRRLGITFVFVTHDQEEALSMSDRIAVMNNGIIEQIGRPRDIYETPKNLFVARFVGEINILPGVVSKVDKPFYEIRILEKTLRLQPEDYEFSRDQPVNILVRPEDLRIWREGEGTEEERENLFPGSVEEIIYKGSTVDMNIRLDEGVLLFTTQFFNEDDEACIDLDFERGERVHVDWVKDWEVILPYED